MTTVADVMTTNPEVLDTYSTISKAAKLMKAGEFGVVPVVKDDLVVGVVTDRDLVVRGLAGGLGPEDSVDSIMTTDVTTVGPNDDVTEVRQLMIDGALRRVPVVDGGTLVGIISLGDLAEHGGGDDVLAEVSKAAPNN
ncbi:CBS domain-containing protein [Bowdeniella nasicola]|uniref:CBS domain-containing protein n=1 Tax=Bowdeniella nasicola TaxID=208480 RepID=A0A1H3YSV1_9ACTO|nr:MULTISPECIES: CBS domain-containing protein [Bowdeniella]SEA14132.1 CBS domain-containing protein [Bowdeniella nasicola]